MSIAVNAYAAVAAAKPLEKTTIERRDLRPHDVLIDIAFAGICHSDIHTVRAEWGETQFPLVPGHEIAGIVAEVGSEVTRFSPGDRVGVGCFSNSCQECDACLDGDEQYCAKGVGTYASVDVDGSITQGGYASKTVIDERFLLKIPEGIGLDEAAPLLCAGITTYSPLKHWHAGPGKKVAVIGLGGLGHMGVKLAAALGAEVTVLSQTLSKQEDGKRLGATDYRATSDPATFKELRGTFDLILNTVSADIPIDQYLRLLRRNGALVLLGLPNEPLSIPGRSLIGGRKSIGGSMVGGIAETQEMLDFCAQHGIGADIETISAEQINEAYERVLRRDVRYRFVIDAATF